MLHARRYQSFQSMTALMISVRVSPRSSVTAFDVLDSATGFLAVPSRPWLSSEEEGWASSSVGGGTPSSCFDVEVIIGSSLSLLILSSAHARSSGVKNQAVFALCGSQRNPIIASTIV